MLTGRRAEGGGAAVQRPSLLPRRPARALTSARGCSAGRSWDPPAPRTHAHALTRTNKYGPDGTAVQPLRSVGPQGPPSSAPSRGGGGPYDWRAAAMRPRSSGAPAPGGDPARRRESLRWERAGPQLSEQRSRRLSCRLSLRRRCSRPRSRRSSSSRALRGNGCKSESGPLTSSAPTPAGASTPLPRPGTSQRGPYPTHIRSLWSRFRTSSSRWFTSDTSSSSRSCSRCCCAAVFSQSEDGGG